jgi:chaperone required for assembly of F1-ATPase
MRRFYKIAAVEAVPGGFVIALDGKPLRTPQGRMLALPHATLAEAVADEWRAQGALIRPLSMPVTAIVNTAVDRVAADRASAIAQLMRYAETDLLCYRAEGPDELVERQAALWQPVLDWAASRFGATLAVTTGIAPTPQPDHALNALHRAVAGHDEWRLAALAAAVAATGSLLLGLALAEERLTPDQAFAAALLEELWQNERWGEDAEALARRAALRTDLDAAARLFRVLGGRPRTDSSS